MSDRFSNFHTHTCLCDGKDTPEELVLRALELGCPALGFSGHSYAPYDEGYCMSVAQTAEYKAEIRRLQQKYTGRICIYMGIEQDFYSEAFTEEYDYVIGSVHYLRKNGAYLPVDASQAQQAQAVQDYYDWDLNTRLATLEDCEPHELFSEEIKELVNAAFRKLPEKTRRVFRMHRIEGKSYKEIADSTGLTVKGVDFHIQKALKLFRKELKDYFPLFLLFY